MFNFDYITKEDIKERNPKSPQKPEQPYQASGYGKTSALLNLINREPDID